MVHRNHGGVKIGRACEPSLCVAVFATQAGIVSRVEEPAGLNDSKITCTTFVIAKTLVHGQRLATSAARHGMWRAATGWLAAMVTSRKAVKVELVSPPRRTTARAPPPPHGNNHQTAHISMPDQLTRFAFLLRNRQRQASHSRGCSPTRSKPKPNNYDFKNATFIDLKLI